jgi:two-component system, OmpR family, response regulator
MTNERALARSEQPTDASAPRVEAPTHVLVVDDDEQLRILTAEFLRAQGFVVHTAAHAAAARLHLDQQPTDVVVLDVMMPGEDGLSLARSLASRSDLAILMISALGQETDRIIGLEVGADDYLSKPINPRELLARIRAVLRRRQPRANRAVRSERFMFSGWQYDPSKRALSDPGQVSVALSSGEFALLQVFLEHPQRILSRDQLLEYTRGDDNENYDRAIDTQVSRLRRKLASRTNDELIRTIRNEGYQFVPKVQRL